MIKLEIIKVAGAKEATLLVTPKDKPTVGIHGPAIDHKTFEILHTFDLSEESVGYLLDQLSGQVLVQALCAKGYHVKLTKPRGRG